jgi:predicted RNase H-like nuclease (RuvC/YqgF family)
MNIKKMKKKKIVKKMEVVEEPIRKNISLQILQEEEDRLSEPDETSADILQEFEDFQYPVDSKRQLTIDQFFTPYTVEKKSENDTNKKIEELELENQVLKIEVKELKDKFLHLEYLVYNRFPSSTSSDESVNHQNFIPPTLYDRLQTKVKELESEIKKIKEDIEILDSNHCELGEHVELIQLEIDKINEEFGAEDENDL